MFFITKEGAIPSNHCNDVTYSSIVCDFKENKAEQNRTCSTVVVGGDKIHYPGNVGTPIVDLLTEKLMFNSIISTKNAKFATHDNRH